MSGPIKCVNGKKCLEAMKVNHGDIRSEGKNKVGCYLEKSKGLNEEITGS